MYAFVKVVNSIREQSLAKKAGFKSGWGQNVSCARAPPVERVSLVTVVFSG